MTERETRILRGIASVMTAVVLVIVSMYLSEVTAYADYFDPPDKAEPYYIDTENGKIYVESSESEYFLLLPNEADAGSIAIKAEDESKTVTLVKDGSEHEVLDLSNEIGAGGSCDVEAVIKDQSGNRMGGFGLRIMKGTGIGTLYYFSDDPSAKGRKWVDKSKDNESSGKALFFDENAKNLTEEPKNQVIEDFHGRGNASWRYPKKSYQIKFDKKIALIDGTGKEKKWILLAQYSDPLRLSDMICKRMASATRTNFSPQAIWINFYYDGEYRGVYQLSEKVEVKSSRINITDLEDVYEEQDPDYGEHTNLKTDKNAYGMKYQYQDGLTGPEETGGFLIEMNSANYDEDNGFMLKVGDKTLGMNMKSPELGSKEYVKNVSEYFQEFTNAIYAVDENGVYTGKNPKTGKYFYEYCDLDSLVDTYLIQFVPSNYDAFSRSLFFYKDIDGTMYAGPVWDMDLTFGTWAWSKALPNQDRMGSAALSECLIKIKAFRKAVSKRYLEKYSGLLESLISTGEDLPSFQEAFSSIENNLAMESSIWRKKMICNVGIDKWDDDTPLTDILDYRVEWIKIRKRYLDSYFKQMAADEEEEHQYGPEHALTATTHKKACIYHPDVVVIEDCTFEAVSNGDGTHTSKCTKCDNKHTEPCSMNYVDNGDGTHTGTCKLCQFKQTDAHIWNKGNVISKATTAKTGIIEYTCTSCGATKQEEIPKVKQADITINSGTVTAASVKKVIAKVDAAGGAVNAIILGKKVKKISKGAFKKTGIKIVTLKTVSLKAKSVKGSLTGSTVSSVKVKVGGAKKNKKYVKQYKKIFTKKNAGRNVKVS